MSNISPDVALLLSILPILFEVASFYTGRDERAIKARRTINPKESYKKPFHANIWADLRSLVTTLASVVTEQADLSQDFLRSATSLAQVIEEDMIKVPSTDDIDLDILVRSVHFRLFVHDHNANCISRPMTIESHTQRLDGS